MNGITWFIVGAIVAIIASELIKVVKTASGTLRIDHSNPEKDIYRIDIDDLDKLSRKKRVVLKVDNHARLSQD